MARIQESPEQETEAANRLGTQAEGPRMHEGECVDKASAALGTRTYAIPTNPEYHSELGINPSRRKKQRKAVACRCRGLSHYEGCSRAVIPY